jgi:hypothetical protein
LVPFKALSKANLAQNKAKEASQKVQEAKKELDDIAAILSTVQEPGQWFESHFSANSNHILGTWVTTCA